MAPRPSFRGFLKLSLVSCAVAIFPATSATEKVRFNTLNRATGNRLKRQMLDAVTGEVVESEEQVKGYEVAKGRFVVVEEGELASIALESTRTVDIDRFVPAGSVDHRFFDVPYYLAPDDRIGQEAFEVIRDAMARKKVVGLARVVMGRRERVMMLEPFRKGLLGTTLLYPYEVRGEEAAFEDIPDLQIPPQLSELADVIVDKMAAGAFDPSAFEDRYEKAMIELIQSKEAGLPVPQQKPSAPPPNVVNLMEALRRSIEAGGGTAKEAKISKRPAESGGRPKRKAGKS